MFYLRTITTIYIVSIASSQVRFIALGYHHHQQHHHHQFKCVKEFSKTHLGATFVFTVGHHCSLGQYVLRIISLRKGPQRLLHSHDCCHGVMLSYNNCVFIIVVMLECFGSIGMSPSTIVTCQECGCHLQEIQLYIMSKNNQTVYAGLLKIIKCAPNIDTECSYVPIPVQNQSGLYTRGQ